ncbi:hypothetical protein D3C86_2001290 [compost metagenome]
MAESKCMRCLLPRGPLIRHLLLCHAYELSYHRTTDWTANSAGVLGAELPIIALLQRYAKCTGNLIFDKIGSLRINGISLILHNVSFEQS